MTFSKFVMIDVFMFLLDYSLDELMFNYMILSVHCYL